MSNHVAPRPAPHQQVNATRLSPRDSRSRRVVRVALIGALVANAAARAHTPVMDADLSDWCLATATRVDDRWARLACDGGAKREQVWWDAPADAAVNDLSVVATTTDATHLFWGIALHEPPDPLSLPMFEIAIDVDGASGNPTWWDPQHDLTAPGHCSLDTQRACTEDADCHFCTTTTVYTGTANERPRVCGSTDAIDSCDPYVIDPCDRSQTCQDLTVAPAAGDVGVETSPSIAPDYLLVIDTGRWLVGVCDSVNLLRNAGGSWVEIPRPVPDPQCPNPTWRFSILVQPCGNCTGPGGQLELAVPWEAFVCAGCAPFGPATDYRWTAEINRISPTLDYTPDGAIEDVMSEAVAGAYTATLDSCAAAGVDATRCEIADGSVDSFVPGLAGPPGGRIDRLTVSRQPAGAIRLDWTPSCSTGDDDYAVYEGLLDSPGSHVPAGPGCSTGGVTNATFVPADGDRYYLVVPHDGFVEGSYGPGRPPNASACRPQAVSVCP